MLFFRQSFEERKTQIILDCDGKQENDDEQDSESERHKLHFNSDYDILMQKIDDDGCYENIFPLKQFQFQSVLTSFKRSASVIGMAVLNPRRNHFSNTVLFTLHYGIRAVRIWDLSKGSSMNEIVCFPGEENPARINLQQSEPAKEFRLTALTTYTPSKKHSEIGSKVIIGGGTEDSSFVIIFNEDDNSSYLLFSFDSTIHSKYITCLVVVEPKLNRYGETESPILVVASADKSFSVWDLKEQRIIFKINTEHTQSYFRELFVTVLDWRRGCQGLLFITGGLDKNIFSYAWNNENFIHNYNGHMKAVTVVCAHYLRGNSRMRFVECGILITGSLDLTVIVWDVETREKVRILIGHDSTITGISVLEREEGLPPVIITCSQDCKTILWDLFSGEKMRVLNLSDGVKCQSIVTLRHTTVLFSGSMSGKLTVTNLSRTERIRKYYPKESVTSITVYTPREDDAIQHRDEPTILIADVKGLCSLYKLNSHRKVSNVSYHHTSRVNAAIIYTPPTGSSSLNPLSEIDGIYSNPLVISCDGKAVISVWDLFEPSRLIKSLKEHTGAVMAIVLYEPHKCGKSVTSRGSVKSIDGKEPLIHEVDLNQPILISAGSDASLKFWYLIDKSNKSFHTISNAHKGIIRSIAIYHPIEGNPIDPFFVTGSYDRCIAIWSLQSFTELYRMKMHDDYVYFIGLYDPFTHLGPGNHQIANIKEELLKNNPVLVTSSYDKTLKVAAIMNLISDKKDDGSVRRRLGLKNQHEPNKAVHLEDIHHLTGMHRDAVTAMTIYNPRSADATPLILSGSMEWNRALHGIIIVWNLYTGESLRKLTGHSDRITYLTIYVPESGRNPLVFSGSDDQTVIVWEDALHPHPNMPLRDDVNRNFISDCLEEDWPLITELTNKYQAALFLENTHLFYLAMKYKRPDFLVKFQKYLSITLPLMHDFNGINLFTHALNSNDLLSVRTILSSWIEILNKDIHDILTQRMYHASYFFPDEDLPLLAKKYPMEFKNFITSLSLVKNHTILLLNDFVSSAGNAFEQLYCDHHGKHLMSFLPQETKRNYPDLVGINGISPDLLEAFENETLDRMSNTRVLRLHPAERYEVEGTFNSVPKFNELWIKKFITTTYYSYFLSVWNEFVYDLPDPQPIISLMVPLQNTAGLIESFVAVSNQLDNEEIFNSEVGSVSLRYFWDAIAKSYHLTEFVRHVILLMLYNVALYTFEFYYLKRKFSYGEEIASWILNVIVLLFFVYYIYEEIVQFSFEYQRKIRGETKTSYSLQNLLAKNPKISQVHDVNSVNVLNNHFNDSEMNRSRPGLSSLRLKSRKSRVPFSFATFLRYLLEHFLLDLWNLVDLSIIFTAGTGILLRFIFSDDIPTGRAFLAIGSVLLWFKVLYFLRPFSNSGPLGFTQAFWVLSNYNPNDPSLLWSTVRGGLLTSFTYMLGQNIDASSVAHTVVPTLGVILLVVFMLIMMLMMLNLLIALMGDAFAEIRAKGFGVWRKEQASIILEESFFFFHHAKSIPPYLHVLKYASEVGTGMKFVEEQNNDGNAYEERNQQFYDREGEKDKKV